ncbi:MAG: hypothetical protein MUF42_01980 [Cytophagaceae bacterium]|jgi:hypothetical protein|nr:hypothetical protein [Cytophagaceae bacterium]
MTTLPIICQSQLTVTNNNNAPELSAAEKAKLNYIVRVKVGNKADAGTDDKIYIILYGMEGTSQKIRIDTPKDDFKRNSITTFTLNASEFRMGYIGYPYAITLMQEGNDAVYIEKVEVELRRAETRLSLSTFTFNGALGNKGDFALTAAQKGVNLFVDGMSENSTPFQPFNELDTIWIVVDNRNNNQPIPLNQTTTVSVTSNRFYGRVDTETQETHYAFSISKDGGWFGANYSFSLDQTFTKEKQITSTRSLETQITFDLPIAFEVPANTLYFVSYRLLSNASYSQYNFKNQNFDLNILETAPTYRSMALAPTTIGKYDNLTDPLLLNIYQVFFKKAFAQIPQPVNS